MKFLLTFKITKDFDASVELESQEVIKTISKDYWA